MATELSVEIGGFTLRFALREDHGGSKDTVVAQLKSTDLELAFDNAILSSSIASIGGGKSTPPNPHKTERP